MGCEQCLKKNSAVCFTVFELFDSSHVSFICLCVTVLKLRWWCSCLSLCVRVLFIVFVNVIVFCIFVCLRFGNLGGFQILLERFQSGKNLTVTVIYALIRPFGLCYEFLTVHTIVKYFMPIVVS